MSEMKVAEAIPASATEKQPQVLITPTEPKAQANSKPWHARLRSYVYTKPEGHEVFAFVEAEE